MTSTLKTTALLEAHRACNARLVPFAGWEMPVQYGGPNGGVKAESFAVRQKCGLFDVGHMGQLDVRGEGVTEALNRVVSADWSKVRVGRAAYALLITEEGGIQDDIMGYRLAEDHWLVVVNASRADEDEAFFRAHLPAEISLANRYDNQAMIAIQGPEAEGILQGFTDADLSNFAFRDVREIQVLGQPCVVARGGYTGCDGFEWMGDAATAPLLWEKLVNIGAVPAGLGARDILRLEAGLPLYGHELREEWTPDQSGVNFAVKTEKGPFVGSEALLQRRTTSATTQTIRGLKMLGRAIPREGYTIAVEGQEVGMVTSGTLSPELEVGIALALVSRDLPLESTVDVMIRGTVHPAQLVALPFVARSTKPVVKPVS